MNDTGEQPLSRVAIYWRVWLGILACALVLRFTLFFGPCGEHCGLSFAYVLVTWPPIMVLHFMTGLRLKTYLQEHHPEKYKDLYYADNGVFTRVKWGTPSWFATGVDSGDPKIETMKKDSVDFIVLVVTVFFAYPVMFPLLTYEHVI